ncbi:MAG: hypothetical protein MUP27_08995 [Desulfobacterales bacterium]|nr:hypothetical protein [Desulfobacterales bacterium]
MEVDVVYNVYADDELVGALSDRREGGFYSSVLRWAEKIFAPLFKGKIITVSEVFIERENR